MYMKKNQQIKVIEYVHTADGGLARVDQLDPGQYETFRRWLGCTYLNELFRGKAEFYYPETARTAGRETPHPAHAGPPSPQGEGFGRETAGGR